MASLAPGNGWFPHRRFSSRNAGAIEHRLPLKPTGNVYAFPGKPLAAANRWPASGSAVATRFAALLVADSLKAGRTVTWVLGWCFFALVVASLVWLGLAGVLVAAALLHGVPAVTVAVAATLIHVLGATLVVLMGRRIGREILLSLEKRHRLPRRAA